MGTRDFLTPFASHGDPSELFEPLLELGWPEQFVGVIAPAMSGVPLVRLGEPERPRIIVVPETDAAVSEAISLGYSGEATFTVQVGHERVSLFETARWRSMPGDLETWAVQTNDSANLANLLSLLEPTREAELALSALRLDEGTVHPGLSKRLGLALAQLRVQVFESAIWRDLDANARDIEVLRVFHRLLYVRYHEDRHGPIASRRLGDLLDSPRLGANVAQLLESYEEELDSSLFEQGRAPLKLPAQAWRDVLAAMTTPWEALELDFSVSTSDLAGRLYQSYLEERPRREPDGGQLFPTAKAVDERLARGAYYTPSAVSNRLVDVALGSWLERRQPTEFEEVSVLDPACGSGAFLLSAYRRLIQYFGEIRDRRLTATERAELLKTSIFGADADESALLLARIQLLEEADLGRRELPELQGNFKSGDSLMARPGVDGRSGIAWAEWIDERSRHFDVIVMNPPFSSQKSLAKSMGKERRDHLRDIYQDVWEWGGDLAYLFVALAYDLLDERGAAGIVLPRSVISTSSGEPVRRLLDRDLLEVVDLRSIPAFGDKVSTYVALISLLRLGGEHPVRLLAPSTGEASLGSILGPANRARRDTIALSLPQHLMEGQPTWTPFAVRFRTKVRPELEGTLEELAADDSPRQLVQGTQTGANKRFMIPEGDIDWVGDGQAVVHGYRIDARRLPRLVKGGDIGVMTLRDTADRLLLPFDRPEELGPLDSEIRQLVEELGGFPRNPQPGRLDVLLGPKVLLRGMAREPAAAPDPGGSSITIKGTGGGLALFLGAEADEDHVLGAAALLNTAFCQWWLQGMGNAKQRGWVELRQGTIAELPWPMTDDDAWSRLAALGAQLRSTYEIEDPLRRMVAHDQVRAELDQVGYELFGASSSVRETVAAEVLRTA